MTPTQKKLAKEVGKLYLYRIGAYPSFIHVKAGEKNDIWALVMPRGLRKIAGWWHYDVDVLSETQYFRDTSYTLNARDFLRRAVTYEGNEVLVDTKQVSR